jgi:predicted enzyme related to lactoylglutathione lyase
VLGLKSNGFATGKNSKWMEYDIGSGTLCIGSSPLWKPSKDGPTVALEVADFDAAVAHLKKRKIKFVVGPFEFPTCRMAAFRDPDGNKLSIHQRKSPKAK